MNEQFNDFLQETDDKFHIAKQLLEINEYAKEHGCTCEVSIAKSGYLVSYTITATKRKLANIVTRKTGAKIRIYADNIRNYMDILESLPVKMKKDIMKASVCKRLINPDECNQKCAMGYCFEMDGEVLKR